MTSNKALKEQLVQILCLETNLQGQLIPRSLDDFLSDWTHDVDQILNLIESTCLEIIGEDEVFILRSKQRATLAKLIGKEE